MREKNALSNPQKRGTKKWTTQKQSTWQTVKCNQQWKHLKKWKHDKNENIWRNIDEKP